MKKHTEDEIEECIKHTGEHPEFWEGEQSISSRMACNGEPDSLVRVKIVGSKTIPISTKCKHIADGVAGVYCFNDGGGSLCGGYRGEIGLASNLRYVDCGEIGNDSVFTDDMVENTAHYTNQHFNDDGAEVKPN